MICNSDHSDHQMLPFHSPFARFPGTAASHAKCEVERNKIWRRRQRRTTTKAARTGACLNIPILGYLITKFPSFSRTEEQEAREEAVIRQMEGGEVLDVLPAGEFAVSERLPPLPPPIIRKTIFVG